MNRLDRPGRFLAALFLVAFAIAALCPGAARAQMPVYKEGTTARSQPHPNDTHQRDGVQILLVGPDSVRTLFSGVITIVKTQSIFGVPGIGQTAIPHGTILRAIQAVDVRGYTSFDVHYSYAPADSDSGCVEVFVIGKESSSAADGFDYVFTSNPNPTPAGFTFGAQGWLCGPGELMTTAKYWNGACQLAPMTGGNGIGITASTLAGDFHISNSQQRDPVFQFITFWVVNRSKTYDVTSFSLDVVALK